MDSYVSSKLSSLLRTSNRSRSKGAPYRAHAVGRHREKEDFLGPQVTGENGSGCGKMSEGWRSTRRTLHGTAAPFTSQPISVGQNAGYDGNPCRQNLPTSGLTATDTHPHTRLNAVMWYLPRNIVDTPAAFGHGIRGRKKKRRSTRPQYVPSLQEPRIVLRDVEGNSFRPSRFAISAT